MPVSHLGHQQLFPPGAGPGPVLCCLTLMTQHRPVILVLTTTWSHQIFKGDSACVRWLWSRWSCPQVSYTSVLRQLHPTSSRKSWLGQAAPSPSDWVFVSSAQAGAGMGLLKEGLGVGRIGKHPESGKGLPISAISGQHPAVLHADTPVGSLTQWPGGGRPRVQAGGVRGLCQNLHSPRP